MDRARGSPDPYRISAGLTAGLVAVFLAEAADITVETPGGQHQFLFNGTNASTLVLVRGETYTFAVNTSPQHPFQILSPGVDNNDITTGLITYTVPTNNVSYSYNCTVHPWMYGDIITVPPPEVRIEDLRVGDDLVLTSTRVPDRTLRAEYKTNLAQTNWFALHIRTNRVAGDRVESICGRPEGSPVFIRVRAVR
jgi:hypothetical protein